MFKLTKYSAYLNQLHLKLNSFENLQLIENIFKVKKSFFVAVTYLLLTISSMFLLMFDNSIFRTIYELNIIIKLVRFNDNHLIMIGRYLT